MVNADDEIVLELVEQIPDSHRLFMRVPVPWLPSGRLHPGVFREIGGAVSVDWEKYSTAQKTRDRARNPSQNGVLALITGQVRQIDALSVEHEPLRSNRAHSGIHGLTTAGALPPEECKTMRRSQLFDLVKEKGWEIDPFGGNETLAR